MSVSAWVPQGGSASRQLSAQFNRGLSLLRRLPWSVSVGGTTFLLVCSTLILAPWIAPYNPNEQVLSAAFASPSLQHLLGTDVLGRDVLSRLMYGGRFTVTIATITLIVSSSFGIVAGAASARIGGSFDEALMRLVDVLLAFPDLLMALVLIALLPRGPGTVILALTVAGWTPYARLTRAVSLEINTKGYIEAARALGCSQTFITFRHVIPNAIAPVLALGLTRFGQQLIAVGSLSYLGLGVQPPDSDWGSMLADGQPYMQILPLLVLAPGVTIFITALSVTIAGQNLMRGHRGAAGAKEPLLLQVPLPLSEPSDEEHV